MYVVDVLKTQRKSVEAKIAMLREELADIDIALKAIEARKVNQRRLQSEATPPRVQEAPMSSDLSTHEGMTG
ncbi:MAG: hypothetical protein AAF801_19780 [Pseudomonadota bacterium]